MEHKKHSRILRHSMSAPFIFGMILPLVILDISMEIYHQVCFRLYKFPLIKRADYIRIDRHKLKYLTLFEKIGCAYCGYGNGLLHYVSAIVGDTEKYWCGIKHKKYNGFIGPAHHKDFLEYNNKIQYHKILERRLKR